MRRMWWRYRGLRARWQVAIGVLAAATVLSPFTAEDEPKPASAIGATADADIADQLPFASTTTTVERTITTELAPTTTSTTAPPPPTTTTTTTSPPPQTAPPTTQAFVAASPPAAATGEGCHPSYDPCLPIAGDLDCPDIGHRVRVIGPDEYRLDREGDGVGCESY